MRIAFYSDTFHPEISGISDSIMTLGAQLRRNGHETLFVAPYHPQKNYKSGRAHHDEREDLAVLRVPSLSVPGSPTGQWRFALPIGASIRRVKKFRPDVIHVQTPFGTGLEGLLTAKVLGIPVVGTNHTPIQEFVRYSPLRGKTMEKIARKYDAWFYNRMQFVTAPYQGLLDAMKTQGFHRPGHGQPNPVLIEQFSPASAVGKAAAKEKLGLSSPVVFYSGRLAPEKRVDVALEAAGRLLKEFPTLTFVATGHGAAEEGLKKLAKKLGMEKHVRFPGFVDIEKLVEYYHAADVFMMLSTAETQSLVLMQAYASAVPAVVARAGALPEYTPKECGFLVEPGNVTETTEKLRVFLQDEALREQMGKAGRVFVERFSPTAVAKDWEKIYEDAVSSW